MGSMSELVIHQIPVLSDNYLYLAHEPATGAIAVVDPAVSGPVLKAALGLDAADDVAAFAETRHRKDAFRWLDLDRSPIDGPHPVLVVPGRDPGIQCCAAVAMDGRVRPGHDKLGIGALAQYHCDRLERHGARP